MSNNIDTIRSSVSETKSKIHEYENLSPEERMAKARELETTISQIRKDLDSLKGDANQTNNNEIEKLEKEYESLQQQFNEFKQELNDLKSSVVKSANIDNNIEPISSEKDKPSWRDRNKKTVLIGAGTLGVGLLVRRLWKKREEKKSWRKRALLRGGGILGGVTIVKNWSWIKEKLGFGMNFEDSLGYVKGKLNDISEFKIAGNIGELTYDESSSEIRSYGNNIGTKIDKKKKRIEGLDVKFSTYSELIFMANFINYLKYKYKGRGANNNPFYTKSRTGDLYMKIGAHVDGKEKEEEVISGGIRSTLRENAPSLDPSWVKRVFGFTGLVQKDGKNKLIGYLNDLNIREKGHAQLAENPNNDPVIAEAIKLQEEIVATDPNKVHGEIRRTIDPVKVSDSEYDIKGWGFQERIIVKPLIQISGMNLSFPTIKEAIRTATLFNKMKQEYGGVCAVAKPFSIEYEYAHWGLYVNLKGDGISDKAKWRKIRVLDGDTLKNKYPTIHKKANREVFLAYLNNHPKDRNFERRKN